MERPDQGSPLPSDPAGREGIMSDEQSGREDVMSDDPAGREDVIREDVIRDEERPGGAAAGG